MAIQYNLYKVYALSESNPDFLTQILKQFVQEIPQDLKNIKQAIKDKNYQLAYELTHKIKPVFDLLGLNVAFEELLQIETWAKEEGIKKEIFETYKSIKTRMKAAIVEIKKDFETIDFEG
jgi:hypothetical protein